MTDFIISTIGKEIFRIYFLNKEINQVEKKITFGLDFKLLLNERMSFDRLKVIFMNSESYFRPLISWKIKLCIEKKKYLSQEMYKVQAIKKLIKENVFCYYIKFLII